MCDTTISGGYCTYEDCEIGGCPAEAICIQFDDVTSYCMRHCEVDEDCGENRVCRQDDEQPGFCYREPAS